VGLFLYAVKLKLYQILWNPESVFSLECFFSVYLGICYQEMYVRLETSVQLMEGARFLWCFVQQGFTVF